MSSQKFQLPTMPFKREVHNGCAIGTSIIIKAKPYQDNSNKSFTLELCSAEDIALHLTVPVNKQSNMTVTARVNGQYTSEVQKPIQLPNSLPFTLHIRLNTYVCEVYVNDGHILDFVHRVNPLEIKEVSLEGPLIVEEVVFDPPHGASLDPLPSYGEIQKSTIPVHELEALQLNSSSPRPPMSSSSSIAPPPPFSSNTVPAPPSQSSIPPYPMSGTSLPPPSAVPALPPKKKQDPSSSSSLPFSSFTPVAEVAPQPHPPPISTIPMQNAAATSYVPQSNNPDPPRDGPAPYQAANQYPAQAAYPTPGNTPYPQSEQRQPNPYGAPQQGQYPPPTGNNNYPQQQYGGSAPYNPPQTTYPGPNSAPATMNTYYARPVVQPMTTVYQVPTVIQQQPAAVVVQQAAPPPVFQVGYGGYGGYGYGAGYYGGGYYGGGVYYAGGGGYHHHHHHGHHGHHHGHH